MRDTLGRSALCILLPMALMLVVTHPADGQRSPVRSLQLHYQDGGPSRYGYESASVNLEHQFINCLGTVHVLYGLRPATTIENEGAGCVGQTVPVTGLWDHLPVDVTDQQRLTACGRTRWKRFG